MKINSFYHKGELALILVGAAIVIILSISSSIIEKRLKSMEQQNETIIKLLEELNNKNK